jgi:hypothetical protein
MSDLRYYFNVYRTPKGTQYQGMLGSDRITKIIGRDTFKGSGNAWCYRIRVTPKSEDALQHIRPLMANGEGMRVIWR